MGQEQENNGVDMENNRVLREHDLQMVSNIVIYIYTYCTHVNTCCLHCALLVFIFCLCFAQLVALFFCEFCSKIEAVEVGPWCLWQPQHGTREVH